MADRESDESVQCVLCDETSPTETAHEQHMEDVHGGEWSMDRDVEENAEMYEALAGDDGE